jgi:hypothetical protein
MATPKEKKKKSGSVSFVLMVGDEGGILVKLQGKVVVSRLFSASPDVGSLHKFEEELKSHPKAPIMLLFDMMDQTYVRQTLPPVSSFSLDGIITRKLNKDFAADDIKGYVILDREKTGRKDWNYLIVSISNNLILQKWLSFVVERNNPFRGIGLLPLEAQNFIQAYEKVFTKQIDKKRKTSSYEWQILVSHNKVGGFRQVVLRNNRLIFTRMAQPFGESAPDVIAGNIEQEMINTLEYLKRLGLQDPNTISIVIMASEEIKNALDPKNIKAGAHHFMTPMQMSEVLNIPDAANIINTDITPLITHNNAIG